jgi:flagellar hook-associated protein 1
MTSILSGLSFLQQSLATQQYGLSVTQKNIANANDPSYSREELVFSGDRSEWSRSNVPGVTIQAFRQRFLDCSISQEMQAMGKSNVASEALQQIDALFGGSGDSLQTTLSDFFNSFSALSSTTEDPTLRQDVLSKAAALTTEFRRLYAGVQKVQISENQSLTDSVAQANSFCDQIAALNTKIQIAQAAKTEDEYTLRDSRQSLVEELSSLMDLSYYETESGSITVTTRQGEPLVCNGESYEMKLASSSSGFPGISLDGADITDAIESGKIGGLLDMRDNKIGGYLSALDDLASAVISSVNSQHALGSDLDGATGGDFFTAASGPGTARDIAVAVTDPRKIAAAGSGMDAGNNDNAKLLAALGDAKICSSATMTATQFYGDLVYRIGADESEAADSVSTQESLLTQLKNQRDSCTGVNLDDEAINIIKYQKAYQASARYANILNDLSDEILQLLR